jgi:hypothetical protein
MTPPLITALVLTLFVVSAVSGAQIVSSVSAQGSGSVIRHIDATAEMSFGGDVVVGSSGSKLLTAPGSFQYQTRDTTDATVTSRYNSTGYLSSDSGVIMQETGAIDESNPSQHAKVDHTAILQSAEIETAKLIEGSNLEIGQQAAWDGAGIYSRTADYGVSVSQEYPGGRTVSYRTYGRDRMHISTNSTGGAIVKPEFSFSDFSNSFVFNTTGQSATNETVTSKSTVEEET